MPLPGWLARGGRRRHAAAGAVPAGVRVACALREEVDDLWGVAMSRMQLGRVLAAMGERDRARDLLLRALRTAWDVSIAPIVVEALAELAALELPDGETVHARQVLVAVIRHPAAPGPVRERALALVGDAAVEMPPRNPAHAVNELARAMLSAGPAARKG